MAESKEYRYTGELATPIEPVKRPTLVAYVNEGIDGAIAAELQRIKSEKARKIRLLMSHHGVDPDGTYAKQELLWALINAHVPGLTVDDAVGRGHPQSWTTSKCLRLIADVRTTMEGGVTKTEALRRLKKGNWSDAKSLTQRLSDAYKKPFVKALLELGMDKVPASHWRDFADAYADQPERSET